MVQRWAGRLSIVAIISWSTIGSAGFIRHDVPPTQYEQLAQIPAFAATGYIYHDSIGFWHTGVLVAPNVVLTSAHAFDPEFTGSVTRPLVDIFFGTSANPFEGTTYSVTDILLNPAWPNRPAEHDLALLKLDRPVEGIVPARVRAIHPLGQVGVSVGYGIQGDGFGRELTDTVWRLAHEVTIDFVGPEDGKLIEAVGAPPEEAANVGTTIRSDFDHPEGSTNTYGSAWPLPLEGGTATGDSGGPLYLPSTTGEWFVVGILFGGFNPYGADFDEDGYGDVSLWSPLFSATNQEFLRSNDIPVVPEPSTILMTFIGLLGGTMLLLIRRL